MLEIGKIYRMSRKSKNPSIKTVDGLPNFFYETAVSDARTQFEFQRGIHVFAKVKIENGKERIPMIFISSSPFKSGSKDTPWRDKYDPDHGYVRYYGDNKSSDKKPESTPGNKALLNLMRIYQSDDEYIRALYGVPILFFERVTVNERLKGNLKFHGFGITDSARLVTQYSINKKMGIKDFFSNYQFDFSIFTLKNECEKFDFIKWISARYDGSMTNEDTNKYAPQSWRDWIRLGSSYLAHIRRDIAGNNVIRACEQIPQNKSDDYKLLMDIYNYYPSSSAKHKFEILAMEVTRKVIEENGGKCTSGWITQNSSDHGIDYVMRLDLGGEELSGIKIVILGQAKCTVPTRPTNGRDIARTVSRLKRGWIGAYVTTSFFSENVQKEVNEDNYPIMMINGQKVAQIVEEELFNKKLLLHEYLELLEKNSSIENRMPEDILDI